MSLLHKFYHFCFFENIKNFLAISVYKQMFFFFLISGRIIVKKDFPQPTFYWQEEYDVKVYSNFLQQQKEKFIMMEPAIFLKKMCIFYVWS